MESSYSSRKMLQNNAETVVGDNSKPFLCVDHKPLHNDTTNTNLLLLKLFFISSSRYIVMKNISNFSYEKTGDFHPYPDAAKQGTVLVLIDETMNLEEFNEFKNLSKEEKKARAENIMLQKRKENEKIRKQKNKEAKIRQKFKAAGVYDIADQLASSKELGILISLS